MLCIALLVGPPRSRISLIADDRDQRRGTAAAAEVWSRSRLSVGTTTTSAFGSVVSESGMTVANPPAGKAGAGVGGTGQVVGHDHELRHGVLARGRRGSGVTSVHHLQRDIDRGQEARFLRDSLSGDIKGGAMVDRGADDRKAVADIDT